MTTRANTLRPRHSAPVDFQRYTAPIVGSRLTVTPGVRQANKVKTGDSRGRSRAERSLTPELPGSLYKAELWKAIYLERPGRTLNGFPFQRHYAFLSDVKLAYGSPALEPPSSSPLLTCPRRLIIEETSHEARTDARARRARIAIPITRESSSA